MWLVTTRTTSEVSLRPKDAKSSETYRLRAYSTSMGTTIYLRIPSRDDRVASFRYLLAKDWEMRQWSFWNGDTVTIQRLADEIISVAITRLTEPYVWSGEVKIAGPRGFPYSDARDS